jgi:hypothetical protein
MVNFLTLVNHQGRLFITPPVAGNLNILKLIDLFRARRTIGSDRLEGQEQAIPPSGYKVQHSGRCILGSRHSWLGHYVPDASK